MRTMKRPTELGVSGLRYRLRRFGLDIEERAGEYRVTRPQSIATFESLEALRAFVLGAEIASPPPVRSVDSA